MELHRCGETLMVGLSFLCKGKNIQGVVDEHDEHERKFGPNGG